MRRFAVLTLGLATLGTAVVARADHDPEGKPYRLSVLYRGLYVRATAGTATITEHDAGAGYTTIHGDAAYPLPLRGRLPVRPGAGLLVLTDARWRKLSAGLIRLRRIRRPHAGYEEIDYLRSVRARRVPGRPRRWRVRLPQRLRGADVLELSVRGRGPGPYRRDSVNFWAGLRPLRQR